MLKPLAGLSRLLDLALTAWECPTDKPGDKEGVLGDVHAWQLLTPCHTLTCLVLGDSKCADTLRSMEGPGLAMVGRLMCLHHLALCNMSVLDNSCLHEYLLPLPASLRRLELESDAVLPGVQASATGAGQPAGSGQGAGLLFGCRQVDVYRAGSKGWPSIVATMQYCLHCCSVCRMSSRSCTSTPHAPLSFNHHISCKAVSSYQGCTTGEGVSAALQGCTSGTVE
jgi:hypothetical protein